MRQTSPFLLGINLISTTDMFNPPYPSLTNEIDPPRSSQKVYTGYNSPLPTCGLVVFLQQHPSVQIKAKKVCLACLIGN